ncbi:hypothetical protein Leryth_006061 [Lithospermum erythrorhizon]|nr:hypothetical protein Leryth_006061 [Lithospermum erythrorhizon]
MVRISQPENTFCNPLLIWLMQILVFKLEGERKRRENIEKIKREEPDLDIKENTKVNNAKTFANIIYKVSIEDRKTIIPLFLAHLSCLNQDLGSNSFFGITFWLQKFISRLSAKNLPPTDKSGSKANQTAVSAPSSGEVCPAHAVMAVFTQPGQQQLIQIFSQSGLSKRSLVSNLIMSPHLLAVASTQYFQFSRRIQKKKMIQKLLSGFPHQLLISRKFSLESSHDRQEEQKEYQPKSGKVITHIPPAIKSAKSRAHIDDTSTESRRSHQRNHSFYHAFGTIVVGLNNLFSKFNRIVCAEIEIDSCIVYLGICIESGTQSKPIMIKDHESNQRNQRVEIF